MARTKRRSVRDKVRRKSEQQRGTDFGYLIMPEGAKLFKPEKEGNVKLDIIPYEVKSKNNPYADKGDLYYERTFWIHGGLGEEGRDKVVCPLKNAGQPCPVCEHIKDLKKNYDANKDEISALKLKERQLFNLVKSSNPDEMLVWDVSYYLFGKLLETRIKASDEDDEYDAFADIEGGKTLRVYFDEKSFGGHKYYEASSIDFKDRKEDYDDEIIDEAFDLDAMLKVPSYDEINTLLMGVSENPTNNDDEDDEDEKPAKKAKTKKAKVKKEVEPEPDEDEDDEAEVEEKPKAKRKTKKAKIEEPEPEVEDEDEDDEPEEADEEVEEKPTKKKKAKKEKKESCDGCPHGHKFGVDIDDHPECEDCSKWDECDEEYENQG